MYRTFLISIIFESNMAIYWQKFSTFFYANYINLSIVLTVLITHAAAFEREHFVYWPNGTVPFYVNPTHFDKEQSLGIRSTLSLFAQKTCLRFSQVVEEPRANQHVMVLENPRGVRRCVLNTEGHAREEPHKVTVGYSCLRGPDLQMIIMRALGFPFEHNRAIRDLYIDVQFENIEPGFILFFTKEKILPPELRNLPYDVNSVMHFGERDYSKNGHRSFIFKNQQTQQSRNGLSKMDLRKIEIIYGPECQKRDRQAKIDICKKYPSVRIKREIDIDIDKVRNLRANRDITPPSETNLSDEIIDSVKQLNIDEEVQGLIEQVHKITASALENERVKICNNTNTKILDNNRNNIYHTLTNNNNVGSDDLKKIIAVIISHVKAVVSHVQANLTVFCGTTNSIELFQRAKSGWGTDFICSQSFKSTVSSHMKYSTKRRTFIKQSTKRDGRSKIRQYTSWFKSGNDTQEIASNTTSRRRDVETLNITHNLSNDEVKINNNLKIAIDDTEKSINSSRRKKETKILNNTYLNNVAMGNIDSSVPIGNNTGESSAVNRMRRKTGTETSSSTDLTDVTTKTNASFVSTVYNPKKSINNPKIRKKREDDTVIISDIIINVTQNSRESLITNTTEEVKESVMKPVNDLNINGSKDTLRMATRMLSDQKVDFTPVRRNDRDDREFGGSDREVKSDESSSSSSERDKRKRKTTKNEHSRGADISYESDRDIEERGDKRERERNRDREKDRPQKKRSKGKRGNRRPLLPETVPLTRGNKEFYADRIWPEGVVRYIIARDSAYNLRSMRARLAEVNDILKRKTCVHVEEISESEGQRYKDYIVIDTSADYVTGRVGGRQNFGSIELFEGGQHRQHAAMMVMAMLGFYFELARHDRDRYVRVHNRHVRPDKLHHFEKISGDATLGLPYDYASATHPAWQFWRRVGRSGISTVATYKDQDPDGSIMKSLGQNEQLLSDVDIIKINSVYGVQCFQNKRRKKMQPKPTSDGLIA